MSERIRWLDGWRGLVCWLMIGYHFLFDLVLFGWLPYEITERWPLYLAQRFIALSFVFLCGVSARFTRSNLRRGLITAGAAVLVVAASCVVDAPIRYGMLEFLACAMVLWHFAGKYIDKVPGKLAPWLWAALYIVTRVIAYGVYVGPKWLYPLGLRAYGFESYDWVPFFPNIFMFFLGTCFGRKLLAMPASSRLRALGAPRALEWTGRRTLIIYMLHQPVLYGACWLASKMMG